MLLRNWNAFLAGEAPKAVGEYPLFSDSYLVGALQRSDFPFEVVISMRLKTADTRVPAAFLRYSVCEVPEHPSKPQDSQWHGGAAVDEIAALLSLVFGIRLKAGGCWRVFDADWVTDPKGQFLLANMANDPVLLKRNDMRRPVLPMVVSRRCDIGEAKAVSLVETASALPSDLAASLILAARRYQDSLWLAESDTSLAWVQMVSAIEVAAHHWQQRSGSPEERVRASKPELAELLQNVSPQHFAEVANLIVDYMGATKKFQDFLVEHLPDPPTSRPPDWGRINWTSSKLKKIFCKIYDCRSKALHSGIAFPLPMCEPPYKHEDETYNEIPIGLGTSTPSAAWEHSDMATLHAFEYIARGALLDWWRKAAKSLTAS
jgi:hypothetical protein